MTRSRGSSSSSSWRTVGYVVCGVLVLFILGWLGGTKKTNTAHDNNTASSRPRPVHRRVAATGVPPPPPLLSSGKAAQLTYKVVAEYHHDHEAFTQGLLYNDGHFVETTGLVGRSSVRRVELRSGKVLQQRNIPEPFFGEGVTWRGANKEELIMLTWQSGVGWILDAVTFQEKASFKYPGEGWGLTTSPDGETVYMSDGSAQLRHWDPLTLVERRRVTVTDNGKPVPALNELEMVGDEVWANVWYDHRIARIDPNTGRVLSWVNLSGLLKDRHLYRHRPDVLNGIAYDPDSGRLWVTGKLWPKLFEIKLIEA